MYLFSFITYVYFLGHPVLQQITDPAKKRVLDELVKKYQGEEGELTTSMICCKVSPNFRMTASDSLATGRSRVLYFDIKSLISLRS